MNTTDRRLVGAALVVAFVLGCSRAGPRDGGPPDKCAEFNGHFGQRLKGSLHGQRERAREVAARLRQEGSPATLPNEGVTLTPICRNTLLDDGELREGRFVGVITGPGTAPRFSSIPNDTVLWWVFGETVKKPNGQDTLILHSQFLSTEATPDVEYLKSALTVSCEADRTGFPDDTVSWHEDACPAPAGVHTLMARLIGDRPWFGCTRGCCYAAVQPLQATTDSLGGDSLARDTTRSPGGA